MKQMTEAELRELLEEAYEAGVTDQYSNTTGFVCDDDDRDKYVDSVMEGL